MNIQINVLEFSNHQEKWDEFKAHCEKNVKRITILKEYCIKNLKTDLKEFKPYSKEDIDFLWESRRVDINRLMFFENYRINFLVYVNGKPYELVIKFRQDKTKNPIHNYVTLTNKSEVKSFLIDVLFEAGLEISFFKTLLDRIEIEILILRNEQKSLKIENVLETYPEKLFYEKTIKDIKKNKLTYDILFGYEDYMKREFNLQTNTAYFRYINKLTGVNFSAISKAFYLKRGMKKSLTNSK